MEFKRYLMIAIGASMLASGVVFFLHPAKIITGGTPGLGLIIHFISDISIGLAMLIINVPLLMLAWKQLDLRFAVRTLFAMLLTSAFVDVLVHNAVIPKIESLIISTLYGGILIGIGIGLVLKAQASAGGTTIIAKVISKHTRFKPGSMILLLDAMIVVAVGMIFKNFEAVLWSIMSIYASTIVIDKILTGGISEKLINIVSDHTHEISDAIRSELERDGTILSGVNLNRVHDKDIILVVLNIRQLPMLKKIVLEIDPEAFMIVMEASDMIGRSRRYG